MRTQKELIQSVVKAADLLSWLAANRRPAKFSDIWRGLRLSKAATHRLLVTLEHKGLVSKHQRDGTYSLGGGVATLAGTLLYRDDLISRSQEIMQDLWGRLGETVNLSVRVDFQRFCIYQLESRQALRYALPLGEPFPLYCGATGKLLLAMMDDTDVDRYLEITPLVRLGPNTPTDPVRLRRELLEIRRKGYAMSTDETGPGGSGVATPIFGPENRCVASLGFFAPKTRMPRERLPAAAETILGGARAISSLLQRGGSAVDRSRARDLA